MAVEPDSESDRGVHTARFKRIHERLREALPDFDFPVDLPPFRSSYDNDHFLGKQKVEHTLRKSSATPSADSSAKTRSTYGNPADEEDDTDIWVVARVSTHILRLEREFNLCRKLWSTDENKKVFVRPLIYKRLPARKPGEVPLCASVIEAPGPNYLHELAKYGVNFSDPQLQTPTPIPLLALLHFAVGAANALEVLHLGNDTVHGEIRGGGAFHYCEESKVVRMLSLGSGLRAFQDGLSSANFGTLISKKGIEQQLQFVAPEQTGRLPAEPDTRTDIYSLGILLWTMVTGQPAFQGTTPLDVMQSVLSRRIPLASSLRPECPEVLAKVLQKMASRNMDDRYNSASGVKHDLLKLRSILVEGNQTELADFKIASVDVSSSFNLPTQLVGRSEQRAAIMQVVDRASERSARAAPITVKGLYSLSSTSSVISGGQDLSMLEDMLSDSTSSTIDYDRERLNSVPEIVPPDHESTTSSNDLPQSKPEETKSSADSRSGHHAESVQRTTSSMQLNSDAGSVLRTAQKLKRKGKCEIVGVCGGAGFGKSSLLTSVQSSARKYGYFASAKFDQVRSSPFYPMIRVMRSLFVQIFSENDVGTIFHNRIRTFVGPFWHILHVYLELPAWLLSEKGSKPREGTSTAQGGERKCTLAKNQEWLRSGGTSKTSRLATIFLDVLRLLAVQKLMIIWLDDLQFADVESLDLLQALVKAQIPVVLILAYRSLDALAPSIQKILRNSVSVQLAGFTESETADYISLALHRPKEYLFPFAAVVQEKTRGSPFFVREMLEACHKSGALYFCWRCSQWEFSMEKLFELSAADSGNFSTNDFILRRMRDLPMDAQALLAWAAIVGSSFDFQTVKRVMSCQCSKLVPQPLIPPISTDPVAGLQAALSCFIISPTDEEDHFKFAHDRYIAAADSLSDVWRREEMHFVVGSSMMKHTPYDPTTQPTKILFQQARHIAEGIEVIKKRAKRMADFRDLLYQASEAALESGATGLAQYYFKHCLDLLPDDPWNHISGDSSYSETLTLMTRAAEAYAFAGDYDDATLLLDQVLRNARSALDKAPAVLISSRVKAQQGNSQAAFLLLRSTLRELGVDLLDDTTEEDIEEELHRIIPLLREHPPHLERIDRAIDPTITTIGALLTELQSACFWTETLLYFQTTLKILDIFLLRGFFPQIGLGFVSLAAMCVQKNLVTTGLKMAQVGLTVCNAYQHEHFAVGRGLTLYAVFIGHITTDIHENTNALARGYGAATVAGDKILQLLNVGISASLRHWDNIQEIEAYITSVSDNHPLWEKNLRGGSLLMGVRQFCRAMAGKTSHAAAETVLCDQHHSTKDYERMCQNAPNPERPLSIYRAYQLEAMFRFGYYQEAMTFGETLLPQMEGLLSMRFVYTVLVFVSLSTLAVMREDPLRSDKKVLMTRVQAYRTRIEIVASVGNGTFDSHLSLIDAEVAAVEGRHGEVLSFYEASINAAVVNLGIDEPLGLELYADWLVLRNATRPAVGVIKECIRAYKRQGWTAKEQQVSGKYEFLLLGTKSLSNIDVGTQTMAVDGVGAFSSEKLESNTNHQAAQTSADRTQEWVDPRVGTVVPANDAPGALSSVAGLDMIDLAGILHSSQLLSSELNVDRLLAKLSTLIVEATGAELVGLVVERDSGIWAVASTATPEGVTAPKSGMLLKDLEDPVARQVTTYALRFKEHVFLPSNMDDERFSNVPEAWASKHPEGISIIAIPILHGDNTLLGSIYAQAPINTFTERTVTLLKLLVTQIAISIANALLFARSERIQASNTSMLEVQKQALAQAREAEKKAKVAEAEAKEMVRLKDEAAKARDIFLANVSHEMRTPLNGVLGMSEMLKSTELTQEQAEHTEAIHLCAANLLHTINDLLTIQKFEVGKMEIDYVPLSLRDTIADVCRALSYTTLDKDVQIVQQLNFDSSLQVYSDPVRLSQVLGNCLSNSLKFAPKGKVTVTGNAYNEDADTVTIGISVQDTGIGISADAQKKLFRPFSQADSNTTRNYGGTGLGLSICKAIIDKMQGKIWLESELGCGTTVSFSLRLRKASESLPIDNNGISPYHRVEDPMAKFTPKAVDDGPGARAIPGLAGRPWSELKVCIAEDNPINQKIAINFVKKLGLQCKAYVDGQYALDALIQASEECDPFHVVLMDVQMPRLDGYSATREIRKHPKKEIRDVLVIAMTASAIAGDREKCLAAGMSAYLAKPVRFATLQAMLASYLDQPAKPNTGLQLPASQLATETASDRDGRASREESTSRPHLPERPKPVRNDTTELHLTEAEMHRKDQAQKEAKDRWRAAKEQPKDDQIKASRASKKIIARSPTNKGDD